MHVHFEELSFTLFHVQCCCRFHMNFSLNLALAWVRNFFFFFSLIRKSSFRVSFRFLSFSFTLISVFSFTSCLGFTLALTIIRSAVYLVFHFGFHLYCQSPLHFCFCGCFRVQFRSHFRVRLTPTPSRATCVATPTLMSGGVYLFVGQKRAPLTGALYFAFTYRFHVLLRGHLYNSHPLCRLLLLLLTLLFPPSLSLAVSLWVLLLDCIFNFNIVLLCQFFYSLTLVTRPIFVGKFTIAAYRFHFHVSILYVNFLFRFCSRVHSLLSFYFFRVGLPVQYRFTFSCAVTQFSFILARAVPFITFAATFFSFFFSPLFVSISLFALFFSLSFSFGVHVAFEIRFHFSLAPASAPE